MKRTKQILSVFLSFFMIVSFIGGMSSVTASADDLTEWYIGDTIDLNGKWFYYIDDDDDVRMALGGTGSTTLSLTKSTDLPEYVTSDINITKLYDGSTERATDDRINIYIPPTAGKTIYPIGIKVKEGTGASKVSAYRFELIYPDEYTSGGCTVFYDKVSQTVTVRKNGNGIMTDYADYSRVPWKDIIGNVKKIDIQDGVAYIGDFAFYGNSSTKISIPASVTHIGDSAFCGSSSQSCTVDFARPNTSQNLQTKGIPFDTGTLKYTGSGTFVLFDGDTDIEDGTSSSVFSSYNTKTFNWRSAPFNITISETEHGTVSAGVEGNTVTKAEKDTVVTLNVTPDTYYELKSITVTSPREGITEFRDLASVMGDAVFGANPNWEEDFNNYYCKTEGGKFVIYNESNAAVKELSADDVKEFYKNGNGEICVETNDNYEWYFKINGQAIKKITVYKVVDSSHRETIFRSPESSSTGSVAPDVITLTTVTEGSVYTFTMPNKTVTVTAEFGAHSHRFTYSVSGAAITAECIADDCPLTANPTLTIAAPTLTKYGGTGDEAATLIGLDVFNAATGLNLSAANIKYYPTQEVEIEGQIFKKISENALAQAPTDAGDYFAGLTISNVKKSETETGDVRALVFYTIAKADPTVTAPAANTLTYNGSAQALVTAGSVTGGTMQYSKTETGTYSTIIPTGTDVGSYTVWYKAVGDANHNDTEPVSVQVTISEAPAPPVITQYKITMSSGGKAYVNNEEITSAAAGAVVEIRADEAPYGTRFIGWTAAADGVIFADAGKTTTTFTMPAGDVTITASYQDIASIPIPTPEPVPTPDNPPYTPVTPTITTVPVTAAPTVDTIMYTITGKLDELNRCALKWDAIPNAAAYALYIKVDGKYVFVQDIGSSTAAYAVLSTSGKYYISTGEDYTIYKYNKKNGKFTKTGTLAANKINRIKKANDVTVNFMVKYIVNGMESTEITSYKVSVKIYYKPAVQITANKGSISLRWKKVPKAEKYRVYKLADGELKFVTETDKSSVLIIGTKSGRKYSYAVKAYVEGKWTKIYTSDIATVTAK